MRDDQRAGVAPVTIMKPHRSKVVEPIRLMPREQRKVALAGAHYNLFDLWADQVTIDLLSDSGTGALSAAQLAAAMSGDESYAGARSFYRFGAALEELTCYEHILPGHQRRAAERVMFTTLLEPGQITLSNTHFDTTRANVELAGRDLDMLALGLAEVTDPDYLRARTDMAGHLADLARAAGVATVEPLGIHAIYLNAGRLLPHLPVHRFAGYALACKLCLEGGIRSAELGSLSLGKGDGEPLVAVPYKLVRLATPRRVYTQTHIEYVGRIPRPRRRERRADPRLPHRGESRGAAARPGEAGGRADSPSRLVDRHLSCHPD
jgi:tryptophanase